MNLAKAVDLAKNVKLKIGRKVHSLIFERIITGLENFSICSFY